MCSVNIVNNKSNLLGHKNFACELANQLHKPFLEIFICVYFFANDLLLGNKYMTRLSTSERTCSRCKNVAIQQDW